MNLYVVINANHPDIGQVYKDFEKAKKACLEDGGREIYKLKKDEKISQFDSERTSKAMFKEIIKLKENLEKYNIKLEGGIEKNDN